LFCSDPAETMVDWRTLALACLLFGATFSGVWWWTGSGVARPAIATAAPEANPASPAPTKTALAEDESPELARLRKVVVLRSMAYRRSPCSRNAKTLYVMAATSYVEVPMRSAGCPFPACRMNTSRLEQVWRAHRTPADHAVTEAMAAVNATGGVMANDFSGDVGRMVRVIAETDFKAGPACDAASEEPSRRSRSWRIRIRR
jgi:hypothetical protein